MGSFQGVLFFFPSPSPVLLKKRRACGPAAGQHDVGESEPYHCPEIAENIFSFFERTAIFVK